MSRIEKLQIFWKMQVIGGVFREGARNFKHKNVRVDEEKGDGR